MSDIKIRDIKTFITAPNKINLVVVKIETSEPELFGYGCATFTQRAHAVKVAVDDYLKPLFIGKSVDTIEDNWQLAMSDSYWRNGPILNNAISGIDEALWDIKGKMANMPLYDLLGGKVRAGIAAYRHADGTNFEELEENINNFIEQGYHYIRCQCGTYGGNMFYSGNQINLNSQKIWSPKGIKEGAYYDQKIYMNNTIRMFKELRNKFGDNIEFMHDVHERLNPSNAANLAKSLEEFHLFFLEDLLPIEQGEWLENIRKQTSTPIALGELFSNPSDWKKLVDNKLIDFIRVHISQIGGITPAVKLAHYCEANDVYTAWHGPNDISPIGVAAQLHLDISCHNFGIQEFSGFSKAEQEMFMGCPTVDNGYLYLNSKPGLGIEFNEEMVNYYPPVIYDNNWLHSRLPDGTLVRP